VDYRVLGPLEVWRNGDRIRVGKPRERALLALLLLRANEVVPRDELIDSLWGEAPPATAKAALHNAVSALRKVLGEETIETVPAGYRIRVATHELDVLRFETLVQEARAAPPAARAELLRTALAHWRGLPLLELRLDSQLQGEIVRLEELHLLALEDRIDADLELGRHRDLVPELESLVKVHGMRERLWSQLMRALYHSGRQAEALATYRLAHTTLVEQLGIEPGPALRELQRSILLQQPNVGRSTDDQTAPELLERASPLLPMDAEHRAQALYHYGIALFRLGEYQRADAVLERALDQAAAAGDASLEELVKLKLSWQRLFRHATSNREHLERAEQAAQLFSRLGDGPKLAQALLDRGRMLRDLGRAGEAVPVFERVVELAEASRDSWLAWFGRGAACLALQLGSTPAEEAIERVEETIARVDHEYGRQPNALHALGVLYAQVGRIEEGRRILEEARTTTSGREDQTQSAVGLYFAAHVERLAGDPGAEERMLRTVVALGEAMGVGGMGDHAQVDLACLLGRAGHLDEAEERATTLTSANVDDFVLQGRSRSALALVAAGRGEHETAIALADEAVDITSSTDWLWLRGATLEDRASVEIAASLPSRARQSVADALALYERKGNVSGAQRARERFGQLEAL
jgi:DNA-binding SARP family transcriptional activator